MGSAIAISSLIILCSILYISIRSKSKVYTISNIRNALVAIVFILMILVFSKTCLDAALRGLNLWLNVVVPSLFPFFVASELLYRTGFVKAVGILFEPVMRPLFNVPGCGSFALAVGIASGYPMGAKITVQLRNEKLITRTEAERLLTFTNNSGPLFMVGAVATGMFRNPSLGGLFLFVHYLASITVGIIFRFYKAEKRYSNSVSVPGPEQGSHTREGRIRSFAKTLLRRNPNQPGFGTIFGEAVRNSVQTQLMIGGFIILFSVIITLLLHTGIIEQTAKLLSILLMPFNIDKNILSALLCGLFELTTGCSLASQSSQVPFIHQVAATSFIIGWAGLSVHSQVAGIISDSDIRITPYLAGKLLQGIFSYIYTLLFFRYFPFALLLPNNPVFYGLSRPHGSNWLMYWWNHLKFSVRNIMFLLSFIFVISCIATLAKNVFKFLGSLRRFPFSGR